MTPSPARVAAASAAWLWYPDQATTYRTEDLLLVEWPAWFAVPPDLLHVGATAAPDRVLDEAVSQVRAWGHDQLVVWVKLDAPAGLEDAVLARGGRQRETLDVFARDLSAGPVDLEVPSDVEVRWVADEQTVRDHLAVGIAAFEEGTVPDDEQVRRDAARAADELAGGAEATAVGYLDGRPVATGGLTLAGDSAGDSSGELAGEVARLWGGGVVPEARGRGAYRAVLAARPERARSLGATTALVKGRVETSGPVLRRAGFTSYGEERSHLLTLTG